MTYQNPIIPVSEQRDMDDELDTRDELSARPQPNDPTKDDSGLFKRDELDRTAPAAPSGDSGDTSYLPGQTSAEAGDRWKLVQADFVDDPRKSVAAAHDLVSELVQRIVDSFSKERDSLERQWSQGENVSTEELRVCLQRYRTFFSRLLPSANGLKG
ncbi:MAG: hypothetical protein ABW321_24435 [Polyangiales bacterium]